MICYKEIVGHILLLGGSGDDRIFHWDHNSPATRSDGGKDVIDCGSGIDEVWINTSIDGDIAINCETVHSDINP